jgi:hypothetical protein
MISFIEPLYKSPASIIFGWKQEPTAGPLDTYNVYVGTVAVPASMKAIATLIPNVKDNAPQTQGRVSYTANIANVQALLSLPATTDFSNKVFYFAITVVIAGSETLLANSTIVQVPPVGITPKFMKDDPTQNRHGFVFSDDIQKWVKMAGSSLGAVIVDTADFYKANLTTIYTYDGTNLSSVLSYFSDATVSGSPAKLTTYTYSGSNVSKIVITDSTVS